MPDIRERVHKAAPHWEWLVVALAAYSISIADGLLTLRFGYELNPLLATLFKRCPPCLVLLKGLIGPLFWSLGVTAARTDRRLPRAALLFILGWYSAMVCVQLVQLAVTP